MSYVNVFTPGIGFIGTISRPIFLHVIGLNF